MWVKICGTTNLPDAELARAHGADALGFIFAPSKRRVTVEQAAAITAALPLGVDRVGVFTEPAVATIADTVRRAGLTAVQLHMPHDPIRTERLREALGPEVRLIQVLGIASEWGTAAGRAGGPGERELTAELLAAQLAAQLGEVLADRALWAILLDSVKAGNSGGLGLRFPWRATRSVMDGVLAGLGASGGLPVLEQAAVQPKILLAGGLDAENVAEAIAILRPWGVDCVSGVEGSPGQKDAQRLARFFAAARAER